MVTGLLATLLASSARVQKLLQETKVVFNETPSGLKIRTEQSKRCGFGWFNSDYSSVTYEVLLSFGVSTNATTVNGNVVIKAVTGIQAQSTNGRIVIISGEGAIDASTTNGSINVEA